MKSLQSLQQAICCASSCHVGRSTVWLRYVRAVIVWVLHAEQLSKIRSLVGYCIVFASACDFTKSVPRARARPTQLVLRGKRFLPRAPTLPEPQSFLPLHVPHHADAVELTVVYPRGLSGGLSQAKRQGAGLGWRVGSTQCRRHVWLRCSRTTT